MAGFVAARGQGRCHRRRRSPGEANTGLASEVNAPEFIEQLSGAAPSSCQKGGLMLCRFAAGELHCYGRGAERGYALFRCVEAY